MKTNPYTLKKLSSAYKKAEKELQERHEHVYYFKAVSKKELTEEIVARFSKKGKEFNEYKITKKVRNVLFENLKIMNKNNFNLGFNNVFIKDWAVFVTEKDGELLLQPAITFSRQP